MGDASVTCTRHYINPLGLEGVVTEVQESVGSRSDMDSTKRRKRSTMKKRISKRQDITLAQKELSESVTLVRAAN